MLRLGVGTTAKDILIYLPPYTEKPRRATKETATMKSLLTSSTVALSFIPRYIHMQTCPDGGNQRPTKKSSTMQEHMES
jgi:hypothetical protein